MLLNFVKSEIFLREAKAYTFIFFITVLFICFGHYFIIFQNICSVNSVRVTKFRGSLRFPLLRHKFIIIYRNICTVLWLFRIFSLSLLFHAHFPIIFYKPLNSLYFTLSFFPLYTHAPAYFLKFEYIYHQFIFLNLFVFSPKTHAIICAFSLLAKFLPLFMILNSGILHPLYKKRADLCGYFPHRSVLIVQTFLFIYFIFKKSSHLLLFAALNISDYSHNLSD